jgi:hypothetical protein
MLRDQGTPCAIGYDAPMAAASWPGILGELASTVRDIPKDDILHRDQLARAIAELHRALIQG